MDLTRTDTVMPPDERPARRDGTCFYCSQPMGAAHRPDCVIVERTVVLRMTIEVVVGVPRDWDVGMIEFHKNESSWCVDNLLEQLGSWAASEDQNCGCACHATSFEFLREATAEDHASLPLLLDERSRDEQKADVVK